MRGYGGGVSTGLDQGAIDKITSGFTPRDLAVSEAEKEVLRGLAAEVSRVAAGDREREKRLLWKEHNMLRKTRPVVFCDPENGWNEIVTEAQMRCRGKIARRWEMDLRKEIFWGREMGDDRPVEPFFDVPYTVTPDDWGVKALYRRSESLGSYVWESPVKDYERDLGKLHSPLFEIDWETTKGSLALAEELFGRELSVRLKGTWWWSLGITLPAVTLRGLERVMYDFIDHPGKIKELFSKISRGHMDKLDRLEAEGLLSLNNDGTYVGSGGYGFTDELPRSGFDGKVRCADMWGFCESQETVHVSPAMYEEFIFPFEKPIMERFGLNCYGCCEPLHGRWHVVKKHPRLRRVSCSAWVDVEKMAGHLGDGYIFSMKPNPAAIAKPDVDWAAVRREVRRIFEVTRGCRVELIMKDNHTIGRRPENVVRWCGIAREEADRFG